jgi:hypothetical protein
MAENFIWNLSKDKIYLVDHPSSYIPLKEDYIIGQYDDQGITLKQNSMTAPVNVNYFVSLWNSSYPDRAISKKQLMIKNANNSDETQDLLNIINPNFVQQAMLTNDINEFKNILTNAIEQHNNQILQNLNNLNVFKLSPEQWKRIPQDEVGQLLIEDVESSAFQNMPEDERNDFVREGMDHYENWGYPHTPEHLYDILTVNPSTVNWNVLFQMIPNYSRTSKWKVSDVNGWTNWETWNVQVTIQNDYQLYEHFSKLAEKNVSLDEFINNAIALVVGPYNKNLQDDWASISDDEEVEMKKRNDIEEWQRSAEKQFPNDPDRQMEYLEKMERLVYGIMGEPEPSDIANHWIDESKVNWQEIYDYWKGQWERENNRTSKWRVKK